MGIVKTLGYMAMWSIGFVAARAVLARPMNAVETIIGGQ